MPEMPEHEDDGVVQDSGTRVEGQGQAIEVPLPPLPDHIREELARLTAPLNNPWAHAHAQVDQALQVTAHDRNDAYGRPEDNFGHIAIMWTELLDAAGLLISGAMVRPGDVARMMVALKLARDATVPASDNRVDIHGYTLCLERAEPTG